MDRQTNGQQCKERKNWRVGFSIDQTGYNNGCREMNDDTTISVSEVNLSDTFRLKTFIVCRELKSLLLIACGSISITLWKRVIHYHTSGSLGSLDLSLLSKSSLYLAILATQPHLSIIFVKNLLSTSKESIHIFTSHSLHVLFSQPLSLFAEKSAREERTRQETRNGQETRKQGIQSIKFEWFMFETYFIPFFMNN